MGVGRALVLGWLFVALAVIASMLGALILVLNTDSLSQSNQWLVAVTSGSGILIAGSLRLGTGGMILAAGWRAQAFGA